MSCLRCGKDWTGHSRCHCGACHENFTSVSAFDKHRKDFGCLEPSSRGLVLRDGYWGHPDVGVGRLASLRALNQPETGPNPKPAAGVA